MWQTLGFVCLLKFIKLNGQSCWTYIKRFLFCFVLFHRAHSFRVKRLYESHKHVNCFGKMLEKNMFNIASDVAASYAVKSVHFFWMRGWGVIRGSGHRRWWMAQSCNRGIETLAMSLRSLLSRQPVWLKPHIILLVRRHILLFHYHADLSHLVKGVKRKN